MPDDRSPQLPKSADPAAPSATTGLEPALSRAMTPAQRFEALRAYLGRREKVPAEAGAVAALAELLTAEDPRVRGESADYLRRMGTAVAELRPGCIQTLAALMRDGGYYAACDGGDPGYWIPVCERAARALSAIGPAAVPALIDALPATDSVVIPVACHDQGMYIGDYASETYRTAALAADALAAVPGNRDRPEVLAAVERTARDHPDEWVRRSAADAADRLRRK
jgi:HEAT repeat protein